MSCEYFEKFKRNTLNIFYRNIKKYVEKNVLLKSICHKLFIDTLISEECRSVNQTLRNFIIWLINTLWNDYTETMNLFYLTQKTMNIVFCTVF